ncbi:MAG: DeoR/GlpR transcriptional regulator, partial [Maritimibacter sp.]|nr:DeoR/GlpR transcriptional regulator [Maritimibacter sp.]
VMTPSPWVAVACNGRGIAVHLIGGALPPGGAAATGAESALTLSRLAAEVTVLGACGLDAEHGLSADSDGEARLKRAMAAAGDVVVVPVSAQKLGLRARFRALEPQEIDVVVTDAGAEVTAGYAERGIEVVHG